MKISTWLAGSVFVLTCACAETNDAVDSTEPGADAAAPDTASATDRETDSTSPEDDSSTARNDEVSDGSESATDTGGPDADSDGASTDTAEQETTPGDDSQEIADAAAPNDAGRNTGPESDAGGAAPDDSEPPKGDASPNEPEGVENDPDGGAPADANAPGECRADRTNTVPGGSPIEVGVFCDVVFVCVSAEQAARTAELAGDFECDAAMGEYGCTDAVCELRPSAGDRRLVESEVDQICALSAMDLPLGAIECRVYL